MKRVIKRIPKWCYVVLFIISIVGMNIHITSNVTKDVVAEKMENAKQMIISDMSSFTELQKYYTKRYSADASVIYLLQPKDYVKLYKESVNTYTVSDSTYLIVPSKVVLGDERRFQLELKKNEFVRIDETSKYTNNVLRSCNEDFKTAYVFPIYHYRTHVSEFILFFKGDVKLSGDDIIRITTELQSMSQLIK